MFYSALINVSYLKALGHDWDTISWSSWITTAVEGWVCKYIHTMNIFRNIYIFYSLFSVIHLPVT